MSSKYTDEQIQFIIQSKISGLTHEEVAEAFNDFYGVKRSAYAVEHIWRKYKYEPIEESLVVKNIVEKRRQQVNNNRLRKEQRLIADEMISQEEFLAEFSEILKNNPIKVHKPVKHKKSKKKKKRTLVAHFSDLHIGARIDDEEMGGANKFGPKEEARRIALMTKQICEYKPHHRKETDLVLVFNGDLGQGVIHDIESSAPITTQFAAMLSYFSQVISYCAQNFSSVKVVITTGNHLRMMHKSNKGRQSRQKWDNYGTMVGVALRAALSTHKNVSFEIPVTPYAYIDVLGHKVFIAHGDTVINPGNVGKTISSERIMNDINKIINGVGKIDIVMLGHVHVPTHQTLNNGTEMLINGCLSGTDEFAQSIGIIKSLPTQQFFEVEEDHAVGDVRFVKLKEADGDDSLDKIVEPFESKF